MYKYQYVTNLKLKDEIDETKDIDNLQLGDLMPNYIYNNIKPINEALSKFGIELSTSNNDLDNGPREYLVIKSNEELDVGTGLNTVAISFKNGDKVILLTYEPLKLIYNSYVKEIDQSLIKYIKTDYSYFYIALVNKLNPIKDKELTEDLIEVRNIAEDLFRYKDTKEALLTLIKLIKLNKDIKNKELIINGVKEVINIYSKMIKDYKEINKIFLTLDLHPGNWKFATNNKGKKLISIDPFVVYYGKLSIELDLFNKLGKEFIKNN